jgi:hypothetical protein
MVLLWTELDLAMVLSLRKLSSLRDTRLRVSLELSALNHSLVRLRREKQIELQALQDKIRALEQ